MQAGFSSQFSSPRLRSLNTLVVAKTRCCLSNEHDLLVAKPKKVTKAKVAKPSVLAFGNASSRSGSSEGPSKLLFLGLRSGDIHRICFSKVLSFSYSGESGTSAMDRLNAPRSGTGATHNGCEIYLWNDILHEEFFVSFWFLHFIDSFWPKKLNCPKIFRPKFKTVLIFPLNLLKIEIVFTDEIQNHTVYLLITRRTIVGVGIFGRILLLSLVTDAIFMIDSVKEI